MEHISKYIEVIKNDMNMTADETERAMCEWDNDVNNI